MLNYNFLCMNNYCHLNTSAILSELHEENDNDFIHLNENTNKIKIPYKFVRRRPGDHCASIADNSYSKNTLKILLSHYQDIEKIKKAKL